LILEWLAAGSTSALILSRSSKFSLVVEASFEVKRVEPISHAMESPAVPWSKS
jgi:hypothetical protein